MNQPIIQQGPIPIEVLRLDAQELTTGRLFVSAEVEERVINLDFDGPLLSGQLTLTAAKELVSRLNQAVSFFEDG